MMELQDLSMSLVEKIVLSKRGPWRKSPDEKPTGAGGGGGVFETEVLFFGIVKIQGD